MDVFPEVVPEVIDLAYISDWKSMLHHLQQWSMTATSGTAGGWQWSAPVLMATVTWPSFQNAPGQYGSQVIY